LKFLKLHSTYKAIQVLFLLMLVINVEHLQGQIDSTSTENITTLFQEAKILENQSQLDLALIVLNKAQTLAEQNNDKKGSIDSYHKLALLYLKLNKEETAEIFWDRSKAFLDDIAYPYGDGVFRLIEAKMLYRKGNNFQALSMLEDAKQLSNDRNFFNNILLLEGDIYVDLEKYEVATKNYNSLIVNTDIYEKEYLAARAHLGMSAILFNTEVYEESAMHGESALKLSYENNFYKEIKKPMSN